MDVMIAMQNKVFKSSDNIVK